MWNVCDWLFHLVYGWLWILQPVTIHTMSIINNSYIAINLSIDSCESCYKIYRSNIECPIMREVYRSPESNYPKCHMKCTNEKMTWTTQDANLSSYVPKANVDHTIKWPRNCYLHLSLLDHHNKGSHNNIKYIQGILQFSLPGLWFKTYIIICFSLKKNTKKPQKR